MGPRSNAILFNRIQFTWTNPIISKSCLVELALRKALARTIDRRLNAHLWIILQSCKLQLSDVYVNSLPTSVVCW